MLFQKHHVCSWGWGYQIAGVYCIVELWSEEVHCIKCRVYAQLGFRIFGSRPTSYFSQIQIIWRCAHSRLFLPIAETLGQSELCGSSYIARMLATFIMVHAVGRS